LTSISTDSRIGIWNCNKILEFDEDLAELKPEKTIKSKNRLTCLAISNDI
jgi:hypothetical protein